MSYPSVADEWETLAQLERGRSIARFGDGEMKMMEGKSYRRQVGSEWLAHQLREVFHNPHPRCLVGIPTMDRKGPKFENWDRHRARFERVLQGSLVRQYYSAFITRPDSAPSIFCESYAQRMQGLWAGRLVVVLSEPENSLLKVVRQTALNVEHIECPRYQAFDRIDEFEQRLTDATANVAILSCGPTATILANRLTRVGLQALDLGSSGGFLMKLLGKGECLAS